MQMGIKSLFPQLKKICKAAKPAKCAKPYWDPHILSPYWTPKVLSLTTFYPKKKNTWKWPFVMVREKMRLKWLPSPVVCFWSKPSMKCVAFHFYLLTLWIGRYIFFLRIEKFIIIFNRVVQNHQICKHVCIKLKTTCNYIELNLGIILFLFFTSTCILTKSLKLHHLTLLA